MWGVVTTIWQIVLIILGLGVGVCIVGLLRMAWQGFNNMVDDIKKGTF